MTMTADPAAADAPQMRVARMTGDGRHADASPKTGGAIVGVGAGLLHHQMLPFRVLPRRLARA